MGQIGFENVEHNLREKKSIAMSSMHKVIIQTSESDGRSDSLVIKRNRDCLPNSIQAKRQYTSQRNANP